MDRKVYAVPTCIIGVFLLVVFFFIGRSYESYHNVKYVNFGNQKIVFVEDGSEVYELGNKLYSWNIEKLPNGFYRINH